MTTSGVMLIWAVVVPAGLLHVALLASVQVLLGLMTLLLVLWCEFVERIVRIVIIIICLIALEVL